MSDSCAGESAPETSEEYCPLSNTNSSKLYSTDCHCPLYLPVHASEPKG